MNLSPIAPDVLAALPEEVLAALELGPDDEAGFLIDAGEVRLVRVDRHQAEDVGLSPDELRGLIHEGMSGPARPAEEVFAGIRSRIEARRDAERA